MFRDSGANIFTVASNNVLILIHLKFNVIKSSISQRQMSFINKINIATRKINTKNGNGIHIYVPRPSVIPHKGKTTGSQFLLS